jgi:hypothetical protein
MTKNAKNEVPLPADRAFVLQFKPAADNGGSSYAGRVEHIASGQVELFYSTEELCAKLRTILNQQKSESGN